MPRRNRGRTFEEEEYEEHYDRRPSRARPMREPSRGRRDRTYEEEVEFRRPPVNTRVREVYDDVVHERVRSSSAGPMFLQRPREEQLVRIPRPAEREVEEIRIARPAKPPTVDIEVDERVFRREKSRVREPSPHIEEEKVIIRERDYDSEHSYRLPRRRAESHSRKLDVEIDHAGHRDEIKYRSVSRGPPRRDFDERENIILRREAMVGDRGRTTEREEIRIKRDISTSSSSVSSIPSVRPINAPPIHQDVIMHHRHVDHGFEKAPRRMREASKKRVEIDEIDIRNQNGSRVDDLEIIHRRERSDSPPPRRRHIDEKDELVISHTTSRGADRERERDRDVLVIRDRERHHDHEREDIISEADYYNHRASVGGHIGEAYHGATRDWGVVEVPPGTKRVTLDGVGGASQEISWERYNGARRPRFNADTETEYSSDYDSVNIAKRYSKARSKKDRLWTEITKDLVVKDAIETAGYEYEETDEFFYVFAHLQYDDVAHLVRLSEEVKRVRREIIREIEAEHAIKSQPLSLPAPHRHSTSFVFDRTTKEVVEEEIRSDDTVLVGSGRSHRRGRRW